MNPEDKNNINGYSGSAPVAGVGGAVTNAGTISQNGVDPITSTSLQPAQPYKLAPATPDTSASGLSAASTSVKDSYTTQRDAEIQRLQDEKKSGASDISSLINDIGGEETKRSDLYTSQGVDKLKGQADELSSQIDANDLAARRQIEQITNSNPTGMVGAGAQGEINRIQRENASKNADLAIVLAARTKQYDTAKAIIDRKIDAETSDMKTKLDGLKFFYSENKDDLSKKEQEVLNERIKNDDRAYEQKKIDLKALSDAKLEALKNAQEQEAPSSVLSAIQSAQTPESVITAAGPYGTDLKRKYEIAKLKAEADSNQPITGEWASVVNGASGLVANTKKATVKQNISNAIANNNWPSAYAEVKNAVSDGLTGSTKTKFDDSNTDINVMQGMRDAIQQYVNAGGNLGYLKGSADNIAKGFGQLKTDPKFAALGVQLEREFQAYRNQMTGAAFTPAESKDYAKVNPRTNASLDLNLATIDGAIAQLNNRVDSTVDARVPGSNKIREKMAQQSQNDPLNLGFTEQSKNNNPLGI